MGKPVAADLRFQSGMALALSGALALTTPLIQWVADPGPGLHPYTVSTLAMVPLLLAAAWVGRRPGRDRFAYGLSFLAGLLALVASAWIHPDPVPGGLIRPASAMPLLVTAVLVPMPGPIALLGLANLIATVVGTAGHPPQEILAQVLGQLAAGGIAVAMSFGWRITRRTAFEADALEAEVTRKDIERNAVARFVRHAAHELRTPLTPIRLLPATLREHGDDPQVREKSFRQLERQVDRLTTIVDRLGTLAHLETINDHEPGDLAQQAHRVAAAFPPTELDVPVVATTSAPNEGLHAMMAELLANAHQAAKQKVRMQVASDPNGWRVTVEDDGAGVPETLWDSLKQPFGRVQLDEHPHARAGLGLGLVDAMAAAVGGRLELGQSDLGGLKACLQLPPAPENKGRASRRTTWLSGRD